MARGNVSLDLMLTGLRFRLLFEHTPCVIASTARIDALDHQIQAVRYALRLQPLRLLIADDVGLGKTIITGMIISELLARKRISSVLIVVPKSLLYQWRRELMEKFDIRFDIVSCERDVKEVLPESRFVITSIDFVKRPRWRQEFLAKNWDLVVFDEAHNLTIRREGDKIRKTLRYEVAEELASRVENILLLSATPHHGDMLDFYYRLRLLDPALPEIAPDQANIDYLLRSTVSRHVIRRLREEVTKPDGSPLVPPRESKTISISLSRDEKELYNELLSYIYGYFNAGFETGRKSLVYVAIVFQKRASSSIYAIYQTLRRRRILLRKLLRLLEKGEITPEKVIIEAEKAAEKSEKSDRIDVRTLLKYAVREPTIDGLHSELEQLEKLTSRISKLLEKGIDTKIESHRADRVAPQHGPHCKVHNIHTVSCNPRVPRKSAQQEGIPHRNNPWRHGPSR